MIPIFWRYAAMSYVKNFFLTLGTFVIVLIISRFKEIARFTTISSDPLNLGLFAVYQIPFILPMAIPLSALIASFIFFQKMSRSQEFTALRACGLSFKSILAPIYTASLFLTLINFSICATLAPFCQKEAEKLLISEISAAPLNLFKGPNKISTKDAYFSGHISDQGDQAENLIVISYNEGNKRLNLFSSQNLTLQQEQLTCQNVSILSHLDGKSQEFDPLIIETQASMTMGTHLLLPLLKKEPKKSSVSSHTFRSLLKISQLPDQQAAEYRSEIFRRVSFSFAVFSLTALGAIFGIDSKRIPSKKNLLAMLLLTLFALASYLLGKSFRHDPFFSAFVYFSPHLLIWISCMVQARRITKGYA